MVNSPDQQEDIKNSQIKEQQKKIEIIRSFGNRIRTQIDRVIPQPSCRQYAMSLYEIFLEEGLQPTMVVLLDEVGIDKHYWIETPSFAIDLKPMGHFAVLLNSLSDSVNYTKQSLKEMARRGKVLVLPVESKEYQLLTLFEGKSIDRVLPSDPRWEDDYMLNGVRTQVRQRVIPTIGIEDRQSLAPYKIV